MEQHISFQTAKLAKEKNFKWGVTLCYAGENSQPLPYNAGNGLYFNSLEYESAPMQNILQTWLRITHGIHVEVVFDSFNSEKYFVSIVIKGDKTFHYDVNGEFDSYEEALEIGLFEGLTLIEF